MKPDRLNAFTDGVLAIAITIMVLELRVPQADSLAALEPALPLLAAYALSFVNVGIFWSNHHHMLMAARRIDGRALMANLVLLFFLTFVPFVIRWIGEAGLTRFPVAAYGVILVGASFGYTALEQALVAVEGPNGPVKAAVGRDFKGKVSLAMYLTAVPLALFVSVWPAIGLYVAVALMWLVPDRRFERAIAD